MKILKKILLILLGIVIALLIVSQLLPSSYHVERSIVVQARPDAIFPYLNNVKKWPEWSAWTTNKDPSLVYSYEGPEEGAGAVSKWTSQKMGPGRMTITSSDPNTGVSFDLSFDEGKLTAKSSIRLEPAGDSTKVIWSDDGNLGRNPIWRYFGLFLDKFVGKDFEEGLQKLKQKAEAR
jgi:hypothetical protein